MAGYVRAITGMTNFTPDDEMAFESNFILNEGIIVQSGTDLQVQAQTSPDLTVKVKAGACYVKRDAYTNNSGELKYWEVIFTTDENVTIPANNSGASIRRIICVKVDTAVTPGPNGDISPSLVVVSGSSGGGDPAIPDNHLPLARVIHTNADTSIASGDITDLRVYAGINIAALGITSQAQGDILYFNGTNWVRLPAGTNGQYLKTQGAAANPVWGTVATVNASAHVYNSADQSIPDNSTTPTTLTFDSESWDNASIHSTVSNTGRLTLPNTGKWFLNGQVTFAANASAGRWMRILKNGATEVARVTQYPDGALPTRFQVSLIVDATATDYFELQVAQWTGGALNATAGVSNTFFQCHQLS